MATREDKKELIINKAVQLFAEHGYYKTTTAMIAHAAGVTQPYVFHFFQNKEELFKTVVERAFNQIYDRFMTVEAPADRLKSEMGKSFMEIIKKYRYEVLMVMQAYTIADESIRQHVRKLFLTIYEMLFLKFEKAGIPFPEEKASEFISTGLLITVSEVLDLPEIFNMRDEKCKKEY
ncbi:TetR/AcrR family transcriptional regulator [Metabacillus fastidiosus]|uniref:TetR/AcrR family transcriptional regulator n=1 Tax=Metabacillus fastidiosus TaxID=1458 RepID=UPI002E1ECE9E|nr:TetR/AcrR family transcriptional regulator [Metabacillus fastidiosus]